MKFLYILLFSSAMHAAVSPVLLEHPQLPTKDKLSLVRGGEAFKNRCVSCHSLNLAGYEPLLAEVGLDKSIMPQHDPVAWQGHPPPDLSLVARTRGTGWIFTYLHSFYNDPENPKGYNNLLMPNASMPAVLSDLQGSFILSDKYKNIAGIPHKAHWFAYLEQEQEGSLTSEEYEQYVLDLVNFLDYVAEPYKNERINLGWKVISFLLAFAVVARMLYHSYWRSK